MTNIEIAVDLGISPLTVKWHVSELLRKFGMRGRLQLALHMRDLEDSRPSAG
jgi:DNA-binding CsgD family transcriptional regulator